MTPPTGQFSACFAKKGGRTYGAKRRDLLYAFLIVCDLVPRRTLLAEPKDPPVQDGGQSAQYES